MFRGMFVLRSCFSVRFVPSRGRFGVRNCVSLGDRVAIGNPDDPSGEAGRLHRGDEHHQCHDQNPFVLHAAILWRSLVAD